jgi:hypothetical protein
VQRQKQLLDSNRRRRGKAYARASEVSATGFHCRDSDPSFCNSSRRQALLSQAGRARAYRPASTFFANAP